MLHPVIVLVFASALLAVISFWNPRHQPATPRPSRLMPVCDSRQSQDIVSHHETALRLRFIAKDRIKLHPGHIGIGHVG